MRLAAAQLDSLVTIPERARKDVDFLPPHLGECGGPKMVPEWVINGGRDAGVKTNLDEVPVLLLANGRGQSGDVIVLVIITESVTVAVKEILTVNETNS